MDKEGVVRTRSRIVLSHKKEWNWVIYIDENESRVGHTEWSMSEKKKRKQALYIKAYIRNLENGTDEPAWGQE